MRLIIKGLTGQPIEGAVIILDSLTTTAIPLYTGKDGTVDLTFLVEGLHWVEVHIEGKFPGVKFAIMIPYPHDFELWLYWSGND